MKETTPDLTRISKYISLILRHKPEVIGIKLDTHGWADVNALLAGISRKYPINRDILEEIVGNILDEYDVDEQYIVRGEGDALIMSGMTPLDEAQEELGIVFPEEDLENYDTINGLLISRLDRIPGDDEQPEIEYLGYRFCVLKVENKMIHSVRVTKLSQTLASEEN